ncbi:MAG: dethiobiotin synthase [Burkholderiales bacterium]|nr:dethiobiotin synthase [Burkholderiales bacterium]
MPARAYFVTGTDTEVGKTYATCALLSALAAKGRRAVAMKPVASGCTVNAEGELDNEDVLAHAAASNVSAPRAVVNPYAFLPPISPHLAARDADVIIDFNHLRQNLDTLRGMADVVLVEGAGGWLAPVDDERTMADMASALGLPVILVVGMRLGCLNHALLTVEAVLASGARLAGWVANQIDPDMRRAEENLDYLKQHIAAPLLGFIPHGGRAEKGQSNQVQILEPRLETLMQ